MPGFLAAVDRYLALLPPMSPRLDSTADHTAFVDAHNKLRKDQREEAARVRSAHRPGHCRRRLDRRCDRHADRPAVGRADRRGCRCAAAAGDVIELVGRSNRDEPLRIDYLDFTFVDQLVS